MNEIRKITLNYDPLERLHLRKPVDRVAFIAEECRNKRVLDIGCYDETALVKRDTEHWLHGRISAVAKSVVGIDISAEIPPEGIETGPHSRIMRGNGAKPEVDEDIDIIVAGSTSSASCGSDTQARKWWFRHPTVRPLRTRS
jgi:hypothetical protein